MQLVNLKVEQQTVNFEQALKLGLGEQQGLFFPTDIQPLNNIDELLERDLVSRSVEILGHLIGDEISRADLHQIVSQAFTFPAPVTAIDDNTFNLELFHGPTLAFKDFGARFMAQCLAHFSANQRLTILTATSGDTGAAVAHAFHGLDNVDVVILYPKGKISLLQEKLFATLGGNIRTLAVEGDFDQCQALVKAAFDDPKLRADIHLNSANSINISRLLAQICYYFEAVAQIPKQQRQQLTISVPSGNFGNLTAGMLAKVLGLPVKGFVAATNINDTVPRYLKTGIWSAKPTVATLSNAMDVSQPNNWPRIEAIIEKGYLPADVLQGYAVDEDYTQVAMRALAGKGYISEPHAAVAYQALNSIRDEGQPGLILGTAHPAKFRESVENILGTPISLPDELKAVASSEILSLDMPADFTSLRHYLYQELV